MFFVLLLSLSFPSWAGCPSHLCNLAADGAYTNLVIGKLVHVATDSELKQVYRWAKSSGHWASLPSSFPLYLQGVKLVSIQPSASAAPVTVFMSREEYVTAPLGVGDLVRYKPHDGNWEAPKDPQQKRLFYGLTGCVATLCSANSGACKNRYREGFFTTQGKQISFVSGRPLPGGVSIDPQSLLPQSLAR